MKNVLKKFFVLFCSFALIWEMQMEVKAETSDSIVSEGISFGADIRFDKDTSFDEETDDLTINDNLLQTQDYGDVLEQSQVDVLANESEEEIESAVEDDIAELEEENNELTIISGTITDYLAATDDYDIYSVPLSQGNYIQARLSVPTDININYDLLLYDSNFNLIKYSDYLTVLDGYGPLADSIGYIASENQTLYLCVYSSAGGSNTLPYNLEFSISSRNIDTLETDENVKEAPVLDIDPKGATVTRYINSALDSDWYKFTVLDNLGYSKMRFQVTPNTTSGSIKFEVYENLAPSANICAMANVLSGDGGEISLDAGEYYIRVISTKDINTFTTDDIIPYQLKVTPVATPTEITINRLEDYNGNSIFVKYNEGRLFRVERDRFGNTFIRIYGRATYPNSYGAPAGAGNVIINATLVNTDMLDGGIMNATTYSSAITDENGYFTIVIHLASGIGHHKCFNEEGFLHHYDIMNLNLEVYQNSIISTSTVFYYYTFTED